MCHNALYNQNLWRHINETDTVEITNFNAAGHGFRMWDILFFIDHWNIDYENEEGMNEDIEAFLHVYIDEQTYDDELRKVLINFLIAERYRSL